MALIPPAYLNDVVSLERWNVKLFLEVSHTNSSPSAPQLLAHGTRLGPSPYSGQSRPVGA